MTPRRYAVVAGGGTGGHVIPALAVARALAARGHDREAIELVGSRRGHEATLLEGEGFPFTNLPGRGMSRQMGPGDLAANLGALVALAWSTIRAVGALARWHPSVVVCVGGYASFPAGVAAVLLRVPLVVVNIDAVPGRVNRVLGRFASASAVSFASTPLPRTVVTGTPVRDEILAVDPSPGGRARARVALGFDEGRAVVGVFGGSLGARRINQAAAELAERWAERSDRAIYQVTGRRDWAEVSARAGRSEVSGTQGQPSGLSRRLVPFEQQMPVLYEAADVMVCRAGAMTVAELTIAGVPSVLVPLPGAPGDHQTLNARVLVAAGAAVMLPDDQCDGERLAAVLDELLADPVRLASMARAALGLSRRDAAARVAEVVDAHAR